MSHINHNGNRPVETIADPENPILADAAPIAHKAGPHDASGPHEPVTASPHKQEINPKMSADIAYWSKEFGITGERLHEIIRVHGTHVDKVRAALHSHKTA